MTLFPDLVMRYAVAAAVLLFLGACGSGGTTQPTPPPPPPPPAAPGPPASLAVQAGDGQEGEPGSVVGVIPAVLVRDAAGRAVPGVSVSFAVDSGGGSVAGGQATTGSNGIATAGSWTLGSAEGRNTLIATAGSLAPVKIAATARRVLVTLPESQIGTGGGSVTVSRPGTPIDGLKLDIAAGAFPTAQGVTLSYASSAGFPHPAGVSVISATFTVQLTNDVYATSPMFLRIPAVVPAGTFPSIVMRDPVSGREVAIPTIKYDATSVTGMTSHFNVGALIRADNGATSVMAAPGAPSTGMTVTVTATPTTLLDQDLDSGFRPGVDAWEFPLEGTVISPRTDMGRAATEAWYYTVRKGLSGNLWNKYQEAKDVLLSNRRGFRWVSLADRDVVRAPLVEAVRAVAAVTLTDAQFSVNSFNSIRRELLRLPSVPQVAILAGNLQLPTAFLVYEARNKTLLAVAPSNPSQTIVIDFSSGTMAPVISKPNTPPFTSIFDPGIGVTVDFRKIAAQFTAVAAGTIGDSDWQTYKMMLGWGPGAAESIPLPAVSWVHDVDDRTYFWADCVTCIGVSRPPAPISAGNALVAGLFAWSKQGGTWSRVPNTPGFDGAKALFVNSRVPGPYDVGLVLLGKNPTEPDPLVFFWLDWVVIPTNRLATTMTPSPLAGVVGQELTMNFGVTGAPGNLEYLWDLGEPGFTSIVTGTPTIKHAYSVSQNFLLKATARDKTTKQPVAIAKAPVKIVGPLIVFDIAGAWDPLKYPVNGKYAYEDGRGARIPSPSNGWDIVTLGYDVAPDGSTGVILAFFVAPGSAITTGQTFAKLPPGTPGSPGTFQLLLHQNLSDPQNSTQWVIESTGTLTIEDIEQLSDGSFLAHYSFSLSNGAGGTMTGAGIGTWN